MRTSVERLLAQPFIDSITVRSEVKFLESILEELRLSGNISNDAYLDSGTIQGGLGMLANLIDLGIDRNEVQDHLRQLLERAGRIDEAHTTLDAAVEGRRQ